MRWYGTHIETCIILCYTVSFYLTWAFQPGEPSCTSRELWSQFFSDHQHSVNIRLIILWLVHIDSKWQVWFQSKMSHLVQTDLRVSGSGAEKELGALLKLKYYVCFTKSTIENASCSVCSSMMTQTKPNQRFPKNVENIDKIFSLSNF